MTERAPKVSIIVPVYNAAKSIERCVDSILRQDFRDFELLLMDDGSKDATPAILDRFAAADPRVRVVHKKNSGVSDTRNQALELAGGTFIQFLDADDWITDDATKLLVRAMEDHDADMVIADFYRVVGSHVAQKGDIEDDEVMDLHTYADHMMNNPADFYYGVIWNKMYRRRIIEDAHLRMDPDVSWCEDFLFNMEYLMHVNRIFALQVPVYYYVKTEGSLVDRGLGITKTIKMKLSVFEYYNQFYQNLYDAEEYEKRKPQIYGFLTDFATDAGASGMAPGTRKLGKERIAVDINPAAADTILTNAYYRRLLLIRQLEPIAIAYDLSVDDLVVLLTVASVNLNTSRRQIAAYAQMSVVQASASLQKLILRGFVDTDSHLLKSLADRSQEKIAEAAASDDDVPDEAVTMIERLRKLGRSLHRSPDEITAEALAEDEKQGHLNLTITDDAGNIVKALVTALGDYRDVCTAGFTPEEKQQYLRLEAEIGRNARSALTI